MSHSVRGITLRHQRWAPVLRSVLFVAAALSVMLALSDGATARADGPIYFEDGGADGIAIGTLFSGVAFVSECTGSQTAPSCGNPPARWSLTARPIDVCTFQANRPPWLSAEQFRQVVANAAATWNNVEAAIGIRYNGDCSSGTTWQHNNLRNEIGFDDARTAVTGAAAGVTVMSTSWSPPINPTVRTITEADIVIDDQFANNPICFNTLVIHELGHVLGFGHSPIQGDLMYPSFVPSSPTTCQQGPSASEQAALQTLYGVNRRPTATSGTISATAASPVTLNANASDFEGDTLTYLWKQTAGPSVTLSNTAAATPSFTAAAGHRPGYLRSSGNCQCDREHHRSRGGREYEQHEQLRSAPRERHRAIRVPGRHIEPVIEPIRVPRCDCHLLGH